MRGHLALRIHDAQNDKLVTRLTSGLSYRKTAPGGHHSLSCTVNLPHHVFPTLGPGDRATVFDTRNGAALWDGFTENPGAIDGVSGEGYDLSAVGGLTLTQDNSTPVVFIDRSLDDALWVKEGATGGAIDTVGDNGNEKKFQFPSGIPIYTGSAIAWLYFGITRTGQRVASVYCNYTAGISDSDYVLSIDVREEGVGYDNVVTLPFTTLSGPTGGQVVTHFLSNYQTVQLAVARTGAPVTVADDDTWGKFIGPYIRAILKDKNGTNITTGFLPEAVRADEVVNHLLGTVMPGFAGEQVDAATQWITQLTYHDGATPQTILDGLTLYEPDFFWEVLEANDYGKFRFRYRAWPTTARYEISTKDGYNGSGGDVDIANRIAVYWQDANNQKQTTISSISTPELVMADGTPRVRDAEAITLPAGQGSLDNATRVGQALLANKYATPRSATATVDRPLLDRQTGNMVDPAELEPGCLVHVRETDETMRLTETAYSDDSVSTQLTLGTPVRSTEQILASLGLS